MGSKVHRSIGAALALILALAGCGATTSTVTVTSTGSAHPHRPVKQTAATAPEGAHASPCPRGQFDPHGPQGGCFTTAHPDRETNPLSCPAGKEPSDGGCAPKSEVPTSQGGTYVPTTTSSSSPAIDCAHDGTGGGVMFSLLHGGGTACEYSLDFSRWCGPSARNRQIDSPPGTFLVQSGYEGDGLAFFRWSDGTETSQQQVC